jgi:hypothetical protein
MFKFILSYIKKYINKPDPPVDDYDEYYPDNTI